MKIRTPLKETISIPKDHFDQISRSISALTIDPYKNALYYFFPFLSAFFSNYQELRNDPSQEAMMPSEATEKILREIQNLTECAGIKKEVVPYTALNHRFGSCGGTFSITRPALFIPDQYLFRKNGNSLFGEEKPEENLKASPWIFSDNETRFLLARELGRIKGDNDLLRIAIKIAVIGALFTIYASPLGWPWGLALFIGVLGIYTTSEREFQLKADRTGIEILRKRMDNPSQIGIDTLEKMRSQNLHLRKHSSFAKWYITESGDSFLDFTSPSLTSRIRAIKKMSEI